MYCTEEYLKRKHTEEKIKEFIQDELYKHMSCSRAGRDFVKEEEQLRSALREELTDLLSSLSIEKCRLCDKTFIARPDQVDEYGAICQECYDSCSEPAISFKL